MTEFTLTNSSSSYFSINIQGTSSSGEEQMVVYNLGVMQIKLVVVVLNAVFSFL